GDTEAVGERGWFCRPVAHVTKCKNARSPDAGRSDGSPRATLAPPARPKAVGTTASGKSPSQLRSTISSSGSPKPKAPSVAAECNRPGASGSCTGAPPVVTRPPPPQG